MSEPTGLEKVIADAARARRELILMYWVQEQWPQIQELLGQLAAQNSAALPEPLRDVPARARAILVEVSRTEV